MRINGFADLDRFMGLVDLIRETRSKRGPGSTLWEIEEGEKIQLCQ